jgi:hypothetical protein
MPFPTVKSDPWERPRRSPRRAQHLWPAEWWMQLVREAKRGWTGLQSPGTISPECLELIAEFNHRLGCITRR